MYSGGTLMMTLSRRPQSFAWNPVSRFALRKSRYSDVAGYGQSAQFGPITCQSERTGLTCRNQSGHGFFLSRRRQELF